MIMSPWFSVPDWTSTVATAPRPFSRLDSMTIPCAGPSADGLQVHDLGLQQDGIQQVVDALAGLCRNVDEQVSPPQSSGMTRADKLVLDALGIRVFLVDLVDRDDERHFGRLRSAGSPRSSAA